MHDMRISLRSVQEAADTDTNPHMVQKLRQYVASAIKMLESGVICYDPQCSEKWHVVYIRHQEWERYDLDGKHTVDMSLVRECHINPDKSCDIKLEDCTQHHEVEVQPKLYLLYLFSVATS